MKIAALAGILTALQVVTVPAHGADDPSVERLVTCQESWFDWKNHDAVQLKNFGDHFRAVFSRNESDPFFVPKSSVSISGLRVVQVFPESIGMAVGFSVVVDATFRKAKQRLEHTLHTALKKCEIGDGMQTCELQLGEKRTFMLMAGDKKTDKTTLLGCYYFYEK